jgi:hypothetical protein
MIATALCNSFKIEILQGVHSKNDVYKIALYGEDAELNENTTLYNSAGEIEGKGYAQGGKVLTGYEVYFRENFAYLMWDNTLWENATITARGAIIYNDKNKKTVCTLDFGENKESINGKFEIEIPIRFIGIK